jgi:hypothetical protein
MGRPQGRSGGLTSAPAAPAAVSPGVPPGEKRRKGRRGVFSRQCVDTDAGAVTTISVNGYT